MAGVKRITDLAAAETLAGGELLLVSQPSATVTITATTISAAAADNSFNDSGEGFGAAGFAVGDRVMAEGFANPENNLLVGVIETLTDDTMIIAGPEGDAIVNESAGAEVTITKWVSRRATAAEVAALAEGGGGGDGGIEEAPSDGGYYARRNEDWAAFTPFTPAAVVTISGTSDDLDPAHEGSYQRWTNSSAKELTVEPESTTAQPANGEWHIRNVGAGDLTIVAGVGVTISPPNGGTLVVPQGGTVTLKRVDEDEYDLLGQTVAEEE